MGTGSKKLTPAQWALQITWNPEPLACAVFGLMVGVGLAIFCTVTFPLIAGPIASLLSSLAGLFGWAKTAQSLNTLDAAQRTAYFLSELLGFAITITSVVLIVRTAGTSVEDDDDDLDDDENDTDRGRRAPYWFAGIALFGALCLIIYFIDILFYDLPQVFYESSLYTIRFAAWIFDSAAIEAMAQPSKRLADSMESIIIWSAVLFFILAAFRQSKADVEQASNAREAPASAS